MIPIAVQRIKNIMEGNRLIMQDFKGESKIMNEKPIPEPLQPRSVRVKV
jgi:C4-type Zn-finger protein